jgi:hypothetical protein
MDVQAQRRPITNSQPARTHRENSSATLLDRQFFAVCKSPLLAQSGHFLTELRCPLLGVKRTWRLVDLGNLHQCVASNLFDHRAK